MTEIRKGTVPNGEILLGPLAQEVLGLGEAMGIHTSRCSSISLSADMVGCLAAGRIVQLLDPPDPMMTITVSLSLQQRRVDVQACKAIIDDVVPAMTPPEQEPYLLWEMDR